MNYSSVEFAGSFDETYYQSNAQSDDRIALRFYASLFQKYIKKGNVLDFGCGKGYLLSKFSQKKYSLYGYDISSYVKQFIAKKFPYINVLSTLEDVKDGFFDGIISLHTFEHIEKDELDIVLGSIYKKLCSDGVLFLVIPNISGWAHRIKGKKWGMFRDPSHISLFSWKTREDLFLSHGFDILKKGTDGLRDVPYIYWLPKWLNKLFFYPFPFLQIFFTTLFLPFNTGESIVFILKKRTYHE